jgi:predicted esterase
VDQRLPFLVALLVPAGAIAIVAAHSVPAALLGFLSRSNLVRAPPTDPGAGQSALPDEPLADWCTAPYQALPGGGCLAQSSERAAQPLVIVYLHGRYARSAPADEIDRERRLAAKANARGWHVLALRGALGACRSAELSDWYCWPNGDDQFAAAATVVAGWMAPIAEVERRTGTSRRALLGFSNGGYFAGFLVTRGLLPVESAVVAHAGPIAPVEARDPHPPLLLLSADDDVAQDEMLRFDEMLQRVQWPHDSYARDGVHGLTDGDIDAALTFIVRSMAPGAAVPLDPPLALHRASHHEHAAPALPAIILQPAPDEAGVDAPDAAAPVPPTARADGEDGGDED